MNDPISDMFTRIRNANIIKHNIVDIPMSKIKFAITKILFNEGYIVKYDIINNNKKYKFKIIRINLKYHTNKKQNTITGIKRISKPGLRVYVNSKKIPIVLGGLGIVILSTNCGIITGNIAKKLHIGGEVLAFIW